MKVENNNKTEILRYLVSYSAAYLIALLFYCAIIKTAISFVLVEYTFNAPEIADSLGWTASFFIMLPLFYIYIVYTVKSLKEYELSINNGEVRVKGKDGWKNINKVIPIEEIDGIYLGDISYDPGWLLGAQGVIRDQKSSLLTFISKKGKRFELDLSTKAFEKKSLLDFLSLIKEQGVKTNDNI